MTFLCGPFLKYGKKGIVTFIYLMAMEEEKYVLFSLFKCNIFIYFFIKNMTKKWMILLIHAFTNGRLVVEENLKHTLIIMGRM